MKSWPGLKNKILLNSLNSKNSFSSCWCTKILSTPKERLISKNGKIAGPAAGKKYFGCNWFKAFKTFLNLFFTFWEDILTFWWSGKSKFEGCQFAPENCTE